MLGAPIHSGPMSVCELALEVDLHGGDAVDPRDLLCLGAGQLDRDAVDGLGVAVLTWPGRR